MAQIPCCDVITYKEYGNGQWRDNDKDMRKYNVNTGQGRSIIVIIITERKECGSTSDGGNQ